jgi:hypothetical protein
MIKTLEWWGRCKITQTLLAAGLPPGTFTWKARFSGRLFERGWRVRADYAGHLQVQEPSRETRRVRWRCSRHCRTSGLSRCCCDSDTMAVCRGNALATVTCHSRSKTDLPGR